MFEFKSLKHFSNHKVQFMSILKLKIITASYLSMLFVLFCFDLRAALMFKKKEFLLHGKIIHMEADAVFLLNQALIYIIFYPAEMP